MVITIFVVGCTIQEIFEKINSEMIDNFEASLFFSSSNCRISCSASALGANRSGLQSRLAYRMMDKEKRGGRKVMLDS